MRVHALLAIMFFVPPFGALAGVDDLMCEESGLAGVVFGQPIEEDLSRLVETASSGVAYFSIVPQIGIAPFERIVVGVTPRSRRVFSVSLEMYGGADNLDQVIERYKAALNEVHAAITWNTIGNHHYGEEITNLDVALYRIGDFVDKKATNLLSYDCESRLVRGAVFDELR